MEARREESQTKSGAKNKKTNLSGTANSNGTLHDSRVSTVGYDIRVSHTTSARQRNVFALPLGMSRDVPRHVAVLM